MPWKQLPSEKGLAVGIDCRRLSSEKSGVGVYTANLLENTLIIDEDIRFVCYFDREIPNLEWLKNERLKKRILALPFNNNITWSNLRLPLEFFREPTDLFHSTTYTLPFFKLNKYVATIHDVSYEACQEERAGWFRRYYYYRSAKLADFIITVSEFSKKEIIKYYGINPEKIKVIPEAVSNTFRPIENKEKLGATLKRYGINADFILYVGDIRPRRNLERLLRGFLSLKQCKSSKKITDLQLVLVGKDLGVENKLRKLAEESSFARDIIFTGYLPGEDLIHLYNAARVFVYPSLYEGFGLPILEAMACGTPVITSNISSMPEVAGDAAILINPYSEREIKDALDAVLDKDELRKGLSFKGLRRINAFSWEEAAQKTLRVYRKIL